MGKADMNHKQQRKRTGKSERRISTSLFERIQPNAAGVDCEQRSHFVEPEKQVWLAINTYSCNLVEAASR